MTTIKNFPLYLFILTLTYSCSNKIGLNLFEKKTLHEKYADKITNSGLDGNIIGKQWLNEAESSLAKAVKVSIPYREKGYFAAEKPRAFSFSFLAEQGQKINISLTKNSIQKTLVYLDVWKVDNGKTKPVTSLDSVSEVIHFDAEEKANYLIRIQPELLASVSYTLEITAGPSLAFPVQGKTKPQSFWGDGRDNNSRKHEGVDIFASRGTPALASANGTVSRVGKNNLGGNVVFMRPDGKDYSLYYAHLDVQLVKDGQQVKVGDTVGLIGNTGNAKLTTPHLHFGIYTINGAVNPLPFINTDIKLPENILAKDNLIGSYARTKGKVSVLEQNYIGSGKTLRLSANTVFRIVSATADRLRISIPDGQEAYIKLNQLSGLTPLKKMKIKSGIIVYNMANQNAAQIKTLSSNDTATLFGSYENFDFIRIDDTIGWIVK